MHTTLRISCFGILLKQHLLRHHADALAPKGRLRPAVEAALAAVPADFTVSHAGPLPLHSLARGLEQRLCLRLDLGDHSTAVTVAPSVCVQGILARRGLVEAPCLMPFSIALSAGEGGASTARVLQALECLAQGRWQAFVSSDPPRMALFRPPPVLKEVARSRPARVA